MKHPKYIIVYESQTPSTISANFLDMKFKKKGYRISQVGCYTPYHYTIDYAGRILQNRNENEPGFHCKIQDYNYKSIAICLIGTFNKELPFQAQKKSLKEKINDIKSRYKDLKIILAKDLNPNSDKFNKGINQKWLDEILENEENSIIETKIKREDRFSSNKIEKTLNLEKNGNKYDDSKKKKIIVEISENKKKKICTPTLNLKNDLSNTNNAKNTEIKILENQILKREKELAESHKLIGEKGSIISSLKNNLSEKLSEINNLLKLVGKREFENNDLKIQLQKKDKELENTKEQLMIARKEAIRYKRKIDILRRKLKKRKSMLNKIFKIKKCLFL